jgi:hypothetical protein
MCRKGPFDRTIYRQRNQIERTINRFKQFRRIATRYEKRAVNYRTMWTIALSCSIYRLHTCPSTTGPCAPSSQPRNQLIVHGSNNGCSGA